MVATGCLKLVPKVLEKEQMEGKECEALESCAQEAHRRKGDYEFSLVLLLLLKIVVCALRWSVLLFIPWSASLDLGGAKYPGAMRLFLS